MARRYEVLESVTNTDGRAVAGLSGQLNDLAGNALTAYTTETEATTTTNPLTSNANGQFAGWVESPDYNLVVTGSGYTADPTTYSVRTTSVGYFSAAAYGLKESGTAASNKTAIDAVLSAADGTDGIVLLQAGSFLTNGGHDIPPKVTVQGLGRKTTEVVNRGSTYTFRLKDETSGGCGCRLKNLSVIGSTGALAAVNGGIGADVANGQQHEVDAFIDGFTGTGSVGLQMHNIDGTVEYVEQCRIDCTIVNCKSLLKFKTESSSGTSFGYNQFRLQLQVYDGQTAIDVDSGLVYNCRFFGQLHYAANNGTGLSVGASGDLWQGTLLDIRGEMLAAYTGCKRIQAVGDFCAEGKFYIANGQPADVYTSGTWNFVEHQLTFAEAQAADDFVIASAATINIPGGSDFFEVTGTTNITAIGGDPSNGAGVWEGRVVTLKFADVLTFTDGNNLKLAGNFTTSADDTITLIQRSGTWYETCRSAN